MAVLVTGGAGFIGSHTCVVLLEAGFEIVVIDNLCNSSRASLSRVEQIAGRQVAFVQGSVGDPTVLRQIFARYPIEAVIHFAGLKAVAESVARPLLYYRENVHGTLVLLEAMENAGVRDMIFSSSATVYGNPAAVPIPETAALAPANPYGHSKRVIEQMLQDLVAVQAPGKPWRVALLRYFNPVGAHVSGMIGEDPKGVPNNLVPYIARVAVGTLRELSIYGNDYPTPDGTGVRDYIHVMDLAEGHVSALRWLQRLPAGTSHGDTFNLGTGKGYSVLEVLHAFEKQSGRPVPHRFVSRRDGDIAQCYSDPGKAGKILGWKASRNLDDMMADSWRWQKNNPQGFD